jgi:hypothetical protein
VARREEAREQDVARADGRDGFEPRRHRAKEARLALLPQPCDAAGLGRDQDVARAELGDALECEQEVLLVVELLADERLGLALVRRHQERLCLHAVPERLALRVEHGGNVTARELAGHLGVEIVLDVARQRAGEDDDLGTLREITQLLLEDLELLLGHRGAPLVDLGVRPAGGIDDGGRRP